MSSGYRLLVLNDVPGALREATALLSRHGFDVTGVEQLSALRDYPHLASTTVLLAAHSALSPEELHRAIRSALPDASVPVALGVQSPTLGQIIALLRAGVVAVLPLPLKDAWADRLRGLIADLSSRPTTLGANERAAANVLAFLRRDRATGTLRFNAGTPFEGWARLEDGELREAEFSEARGRQALVDMLSAETGSWRFDPASVERPAEPRAPQGKWRPRILLIDDDPEMRSMMQRRLRRAGFESVQAVDGDDGYSRALQSFVDGAVADLNMPRLDGWGMLRLIKTDHRTLELPVLLFSAFEEHLATLRAAQAGATEYVPKTGDVDQIIDRLNHMLEPRVRARAQLERGSFARIDLDPVGPQWLLRTLHSMNASGQLDARDDWTHVEVLLVDGEPSSATANLSGRRTTGPAALAVILALRNGTATWMPADRSGEVPEFSLQRALDDASERLNGIDTRRVNDRLAAASAFYVDSELFDLYLRVGSDTDVRLARAVCERRIEVSALPGFLGLPPDEVFDGLRELLRRGVISLRE